MLRTTLLVCAIVLAHAVAARATLGHQACEPACAGDAADAGCDSGLCSPDEAPALRTAVIAPPGAGLLRWRAPVLPAAPSPAPDEIAHVPRSFSA